MAVAACLKSLYSPSLLLSLESVSSPLSLRLALDFLRDFDFERCRRRLFDLLDFDLRLLASRFGLEVPQILHSFRRAEFNLPHSSFGQLQLPGAGRRSILFDEDLSTGSVTLVAVQDAGTKSIDACLFALSR